MKYLGFLTLLCFSFSAIADSFQVAEINKPYFIIGTKLISPNEEGWSVSQNSQSSITFGKKLSPSTDSLIANSNIFLINGFNDDKSFFEHIISEREKNDDKKRFKSLAVKNTYVELKGNSCIHYETLAEDHKSKSKSNKSFQYFNTVGFFCRHPANKSIAVQYEVSFRSDSQELPKFVADIAEQFFNNAELIPLPQ